MNLNFFTGPKGTNTVLICILWYWENTFPPDVPLILIQRITTAELHASPSSSYCHQVRDAKSANSSFYHPLSLGQEKPYDPPL